MCVVIIIIIIIIIILIIVVVVVVIIVIIIIIIVTLFVQYRFSLCSKYKNYNGVLPLKVKVKVPN